MAMPYGIWWWGWGVYLCLFKGLRLFLFAKCSSATFIPKGTSIPDSRVEDLLVVCPYTTIYWTFFLPSSLLWYRLSHLLHTNQQHHRLKLNDISAFIEKQLHLRFGWWKALLLFINKNWTNIMHLSIQFDRSRR